MFSRVLVAAWVVFVFSGSAEAQHFPQPRPRVPEKPKMDRFEADGTIEAVARGKILMNLASNQQWMVWLHPEAEIHVTGMAEADYLKPGHYVKFTAEVDKRGKIKDKIGLLTLTTPSRMLPLGVWPEGAAAMAGEGNAGGGVARLYTIHGRISRYFKRQLTVSTPRGTFKIELDEKPNISVDFADYSVAQKGDKISVTKGLMPPLNPALPAPKIGQAQATQLAIELSEPLQPYKKRPKPAKPIPAPPVPKKAPGEQDAFEVAE